MPRLPLEPQLVLVLVFFLSFFLTTGHSLCSFRSFARCSPPMIYKLLRPLSTFPFSCSTLLYFSSGLLYTLTAIIITITITTTKPLT